MGFGLVEEKEFDIDKAKSIINSILNVGDYAFIVVDKSSGEIIYENELADTAIGDVLGRRYSELKEPTKRHRDIKWFDNRDAILVTLYKEETECGEDRILMDSLTCIPNSKGFYINTANILKDNADKKYAIVVYDISRFKSVNDVYGMQVGDEVLRFIAGCMKEVFDDTVTYARLNADVFAYCMPYNNKGELVKTIEKLRKTISTNRYDFDINTSYGIYLVEDINVPVNLMCDRAGMARKTIKDSILKFCAFYDEQYRAEMLKTSEIERDMYRALSEQQFRMYLQPKYSLKNDTLCGAEVLCRWQHPKKGIIPPNDFIPLFEKNGFILRLDEYMWEEACKAIRGWLDEGRTPLTLSVNISRYHIRHNDLVAVFSHLLEKYGLTSDMLTLEITESLFLDKPQELNHVLTHLQNMGFRLEVDDFGSGFSSLNLIRNIAVDTIKIDKEFLDSEIASEKGKIVVNHTISMAKDLKLQVVAEGVETKEHVDFLKGSQCDIAQGFYFAKPMPLEQFNQLEF